MKDKHIDVNSGQLAAILKVPKQTIMEWISAGMPYYTKKGIFLFKHDQVYAWLQRKGFIK